MVQLLHLSHSSWIGDNIFMLEMAQQAYDLCNDTVKVLMCDSTINICTSNPRTDTAVCAWCKNYRKKLIKRLPKDIEILRYGEYCTPDNKLITDSLTFEYDSVDMIKKLTYKNVKIGYGAFSSYVSLTRNLYPKIDDAFKKYFNLYLKAECILTELMGNVLNRVRPDVVSLYNGRHFETRPVFDLSKGLGYAVRCYENIKFTKRGASYYYYENELPHNIRSIGSSVIDVWDNANLTDSEKTTIGDAFFVNRRTSRFAGDTIYTRTQEYGALPDGFDASKRNIVIFPSSEDEFASIDSEYDDNNIFISQYHGVKDILEHFKNDATFHFYLRIHPNLRTVKYRYHTSLTELGSLYDNVTVIGAGEKTSSYSLLDNSEKVLVFGTTMGIEACYWGKPVILLRNAFFNYLDICYRPESVEEVISLINARDLSAKDKTNALKYGFYRMYDRDYKDFHQDFVSKYKSFKSTGRHVTSFVYRKLPKALEMLDKMHIYNRMRIPAAEELCEG